MHDVEVQGQEDEERRQRVGPPGDVRHRLGVQRVHHVYDGSQQGCQLLSGDPIEDQKEKDRADREAIVGALSDALNRGDKTLIGNKGYRRYVCTSGRCFSIDQKKIKEEARFDGKWVLRTNMDLTARECALKYKQLWAVEDVFRSMKSLLRTRPIYHKCDETIRGHVFCSFLALVMRKELTDRIEQKGWRLEWNDIIHDLNNVVEMEIDLGGKHYIIRSETKGTEGKVAQACGVKMPPVLRVAEPLQ